MTILFTGRKAHLTPGLKAFSEEKLGRLTRVLDEDLDAHVILTLEKHRHQTEIVVKSRTATLTAKAEAAEFRDSIAVCVDRVLAQARKHRERLSLERKRQGRRRSPRRSGTPVAYGEVGAPPIAPDNDRPPVVRMGRIPVKPMSIEEALLQVRVSRDSFLVFLNAESQQVAVLFKRHDGQYGFFETEG